MKLPLRKVALLFSVSAVLAIVMFICSSRHSHAHQPACEEHLNQIYSAILSLALENQFARGTIIPDSAIASILQNNQLPVCPDGGLYTIPPVGQHPTCSLHGDPFSPGGRFNAPPSLKELAIRGAPQQK